MSLGMWLEQQRYAPGERVKGFVDVTQPVDARALTVALNYMEESRDYTGVGRVGAQAVLHTGPAGAGSRLPFDLALPPDALPAFRTGNTAVWWEVLATADKPGFDKHARLRIDVVPADMGGTLVPAAAADVQIWQRQAVPAPNPPGWYPDPWGRSAARYWDGAAWTGHTNAAVDSHSRA
jgi:hypothetical protein